MHPGRSLRIILECVVRVHAYWAWPWSLLLLPPSKVYFYLECSMSTSFCSVLIQILLQSQLVMPSMMSFCVIIEHVVSLHSYWDWYWSVLLRPNSKFPFYLECFMSRLFCSVSISIIQHFVFQPFVLKLKFCFNTNTGFYFSAVTADAKKVKSSPSSEPVNCIHLFNLFFLKKFFVYFPGSQVWSSTDTLYR